MLLIIINVCAFACVHVCLFTHARQNRKERLLQKKWSHIDAHLIGPLDQKEVSLKVNGVIYYFLHSQIREGNWHTNPVLNSHVNYFLIGKEFA